VTAAPDDPNPHVRGDWLCVAGLVATAWREALIDVRILSRFKIRDAGEFSSATLAEMRNLRTLALARSNLNSPRAWEAIGMH
jgi:hypothetical protein